MVRLRLAAVGFLAAFLLMVAWSRRPQPEPVTEAAHVGEPGLGTRTPRTAGGSYDLRARADQTSLVIISLDTLRADHTGLGGHTGGLTPNLDAFGARAVVFRDAVTPAPWTLPAHMSLWTGLWPSAHGITNKLRSDGAGGWEDAVLPDDVPTWPEQLFAAGWTGAGFTGGSGVLGGYGYDRGFSSWTDNGPFGGLASSVPGALAWLEAQGDARTLVFLHGYDAHGQAPLPRSRQGELPSDTSLDPSPATLEDLREAGLKAQAAGTPRPTLTPGDVLFVKALYSAKVQEADRALGVFLDGLDHLGLSERTLVAVVSDHGEELGEHGGVDHGHSLYQEQLHVVMTLRWPGQDRAQEVFEPVGTLDLFPTIFEALGLSGPANTDGVSLLPLLSGERAERPVFAETDLRGFAHQRMVRLDGYKLVYDLRTEASALYDLARDPGEYHDLSNVESRRAYELEQVLKSWMLETASR